VLFNMHNVHFDCFICYIIFLKIKTTSFSPFYQMLFLIWIETRYDLSNQKLEIIIKNNKQETDCKFNILFYFSVVFLNVIVHNIHHQLKVILHLTMNNIIYHHLIQPEDIVMKYPAMIMMIMKWWFKIRSIVYLSLYHNIHLILFNNNNNELNFSIKYNPKSYNLFFIII